jgi:hypothetical protein
MIDLVAGLVGLLYRDLSYYSSYKKRKKKKTPSEGNADK